MHTHLRAGAPLTGVPALSSYSLSYSIRQSFTKIKEAQEEDKRQYQNSYHIKFWIVQKEFTTIA